MVWLYLPIAYICDVLCWIKSYLYKTIPVEIQCNYHNNRYRLLFFFLDEESETKIIQIQDKQTGKMASKLMLFLISEPI